MRLIILDMHPYSASACSPSLAEAGGSLFSPDRLFEVELTLRCHNRQLILQVVCNQVADAVKQHVFGSDLRGVQNKSAAMNVQSLCYWLHIWTSFALCHTHHSLWIHQQEVFRQATVHTSQHVLARVSGALPDQEVSVSDEESFGVPSAHAAMVPRLSAELLLIGCYRGSAAWRTGPLVLQDLGATSCSRGSGPSSSGTCLVKLQGIFKWPLMDKIHLLFLLVIHQNRPCCLC